MTAGAVGQFIASPTDLVKVQMQMEGKRVLVEGRRPRYDYNMIINSQTNQYLDTPLQPDCEGLALERSFKKMLFIVVIMHLATPSHYKTEKTNTSAKHEGQTIPTGGRQTSWLFTSMAEELIKGVPRNNSN